MLQQIVTHISPQDSGEGPILLHRVPRGQVQCAYTKGQPVTARGRSVRVQTADHSSFYMAEAAPTPAQMQLVSNTVGVQQTQQVPEGTEGHNMLLTSTQ